MKHRIFIQLTSAVADQVRWLCDDEPNSVHSGSLTDAAVAAVGRRVIVFVPATEVVLTQADVPTRNRQRMAAAVPFLLEEQLTEDVEDLHFALGERSVEGRVNVAVVAHAHMRAWVEALKNAALQPDIMIPEILSLPLAADNWTLASEENRALLRTGTASGLTIDSDALPWLLPRLVAEADPKPQQVTVLGAVTLPELEVPIARATLADPLLTVLGSAYQETGALNLLQGAYSRREQIGRLWRPWRAAAVLLGILVLGQFIVKGIQVHQLEGENDRLRTAINQIYLDAFPDAKRVVDAQAQMKQRLAALRGGGGDSTSLITLMASVSGPLSSAGNVEIQRVSYKDGELNVALTINDLQRLEQLKDQLSDQGKLQVEIQSASARNNRVEARLHIKGSRS